MARRRGHKRRKVCYFTVNKIEYIDYKDVDLLRKFISERGKILPRRVTGMSVQVSAAADPGHQAGQTNGASALYHRLITRPSGLFFLHEWQRRKIRGFVEHTS